MNHVLAGEKITEAMSGWLAGEAARSSVDRNAYLDDLGSFQADQGLKWNDPGNTSANKAHAHLDRPANAWWQKFSSDPENDWFAAQQIFATQMLVAGRYKDQLKLEAPDQQTYFENRTTEPTPRIDIEKTVSEALSGIFGEVTDIDFSASQLTLAALHDSAAAKVAEHTDHLKKQYGGTALVFMGQRSRLSILCERDQKNWVRHGVELIVFSAGLRNGQLEQVPMLQPRSITDQGPEDITYPFAA